MSAPSFEALPELCANAYRTLTRTTLDIQSIKDTLEDYETELYLDAVNRGLVEGSNKEIRDARFKRLLAENKGFTELNQRLLDLRQQHAEADTEYKLLSRLFEVRKVEAEKALIEARMDLASEMLSALMPSLR